MQNYSFYIIYFIHCRIAPWLHFFVDSSREKQQQTLWIIPWTLDCIKGKHGFFSYLWLQKYLWLSSSVKRFTKECLPVWKRDGVLHWLRWAECQVSVQRVKLYCMPITKCHMLSYWERIQKEITQRLELSSNKKTRFEHFYEVCQCCWTADTSTN